MSRHLRHRADDGEGTPCSKRSIGQSIPRLRRLCATAGVLLLTCFTAVWSQTKVYKGGVTQNVNPLDPANFPNENALLVQPETMPTAVRGRQSFCQPPDPSWRVLAQSGGYCLYAAPLPAVAQQRYRGATVVPLQQIRGIEAQGGWCGVDPWNPNKAVCIQGPAQTRSPSGIVLGTPGPTRSRRSGDACLPFGPGGYDYCQNPVGTQPAGCNCSRSWQPGNVPNGERFGDVPNASGGNASYANQGPPGRTQPANPLQYGKGLFEGLEDCAGSFRDMAGAVGFMLEGNFVAAANTLGLQPGQSVTLRLIYQEATTQNIGISPEAAGRIAGRRLCSYAIVPSIGKGLKPILKGLRPSVGTRFNPLRGSAISENATSLSGKFMQTTDGPVQLGAKLGDGQFGSVYKLPKGRAIKVGTMRTDAGESFLRQKAGSQLLREAGIPTPRIHDVFAEGNGSYLIMDDVTATGAANPWKNVKMLREGVSKVDQLTPTELNAARDLYRKIRDAGLTWEDGHLNNIFWFGDGEAGVIDSDMVFRSSDYLDQPLYAKKMMSGVLFQAGVYGNLPEWNSLESHMMQNPALQMDHLWRARFGDQL